jgi:site-specific DNA-methyltransferase (adenine-specific)
MDKPKMLHDDDSAPLDTLPMMYDCLSEGGAIYLATRWDMLPVWKEGMEHAGFVVKNCIFWDKGNHTAGDLEGDFGSRVELFLYAHKGRHKLRGKRHDNLWKFMRDKASKHPTPKPVGLLAQMIQCSSDDGDYVLDPFMGSGSTGVAAIGLGRKFIGCEIEKEYFDMACERIASVEKTEESLKYFKDRGLSAQERLF